MKPRPRTLHSPLTVRLEPDMRNRFQQIARQSGKTESELLREVIAIVTENDTSHTRREKSGNRQTGNQENVTPGTDIRQITLRIPGTVMDTARQRATTRGMSLSRWISSLVQANLFRVPVMTKEELLVLRSSNFELAAIGRNLNQITRVLNADPTEAAMLNKTLIEALQSSVTQNRNIIRNLIKASNRTWETDNAATD